MPVMYKEIQIGNRRVDFLFEDKISCELKAVIELEKVHLAQAINYLEGYNLEIGLLLTLGIRAYSFTVSKITSLDCDGCDGHDSL